MQQVEAKTARAAVSCSTAAALGCTSSSPGTYESHLLHNAADVAQSSASTALAVAELRAKFHKRCLQTDAFVEQYAVGTSATAKRTTGSGFAGVTATHTIATSRNWRNPYNSAVSKSHLTSIYSLNLSNSRIKDTPSQDNNRTACPLERERKHVLASWTAARSAAAKGDQGGSEFCWRHRTKEAIGRYVNQLSPSPHSWCNRINILPTTRRMAYPFLSCTSATNSAVVETVSVKVATDRGTPLDPDARTAAAGCSLATSFKGETAVGDRTVIIQGLMQPDMADAVEHGNVSQQLHHGYTDNGAARESGRAERPAVLAARRMATSPQGSTDSVLKPSTGQPTQHKKLLNTERHHGSQAKDTTLECTFGQTGAADALTNVPRVSSADDSNRHHVDATQKHEVSTANMYLFSYPPPKNPLATSTLQHFQERQQQKRNCNLQRGQDPRGEQLPQQLQHQQNTGCQQHQNNRNSGGKSNPSPTHTTADRLVKRNAVTAPAAEVYGGVSLSPSSPPPVSSFTRSSLSVFSSAVSSPAATVGDSSNRGLLTHPYPSTSGTTGLESNGSGSPSLRGMAQNLNSIRNGLLRAVEETRQSFMKLRLSSETLNDGIKSLEKRSTAHDSICGRSSTRGTNSKNLHKNDREIKQRRRRKHHCTADRTVYDRKTTVCIGDSHSTNTNYLTGGSRRDHGHARQSKHRSVKPKDSCASHESEQQDAALLEDAELHSDAPRLIMDPHLSKVERARLKKQRQEQLHGHYQQLQRWQESPQDHLQTQPQNQRLHHHRTSRDKPQNQAGQQQQQQASHHLPQQKATCSTWHSVEPLTNNSRPSSDENDEFAATLSQRQYSEEHEPTKWLRHSAEEQRRGRRCTQQRLPEMEQQQQSPVQVQHTQPSGPVTRSKTVSSRNSNKASSFSSHTGDNVSIDGASHIKGQNWTPVSSVAAAEAVSSFATPQVSHFPSPQTAVQESRQSNDTVIRIPQQACRPFALSPAGAAAVATTSGVLSRIDAGQTAHRALPVHAAYPRKADSSSSPPTTGAAAAVSSTPILDPWGTIVPCFGHQQYEVVEDSETERLRATDRDPQCATEPHSHLQPTQQNSAEYEEEDRKARSHEGDRPVEEHGTQRVLDTAGQHRCCWQSKQQNRVELQANDITASSHERNSQTEEQEKRRKGVPLPSRQQLSRQQVSPMKSAHAACSVNVASPLVSSPCREKIEGRTSTKGGGRYDETSGPAASRNEDPSARKQLLTEQRQALPGTQSDLQIYPGGANSHSGSSGRKLPSHKTSEGTVADASKEYEGNYTLLLQMQRARRQDSLQLSPSSCWDTYTSRSAGTATSSRHSSRPQSGSSAGRRTAEKQSDFLSLGLQHNPVHPHSSDQHGQQQQQRVAQRGHGTAGQHQHPDHERSSDRPSQSENPLQQHKELPQQPHQQRPTPEVQECDEQQKNVQKGDNVLKTRSSPVTPQQQSPLLAQLQSLEQNQHLRHTPLLEKPQQQQEQTQLSEQNRGSDSSEVAAGYSVAQRSTLCKAAQETAVSAYRKCTWEAEHPECQAVQACPTRSSSTHGIEDELLCRNEAIRFQVPQHLRLQFSGAPRENGTTSARPVQGPSSVYRAAPSGVADSSLSVVATVPLVSSSGIVPQAPFVGTSTDAAEGGATVSPRPAADSVCPAGSLETTDAGGIPVRAAAIAAAVVKVNDANKVPAAIEIVTRCTPRLPVKTTLDDELQRQQRRQSHQELRDPPRPPLVNDQRHQQPDSRHSLASTHNRGADMKGSFAVRSTEGCPECLFPVTTATVPEPLSMSDVNEVVPAAAFDSSAYPPPKTVPNAPSKEARASALPAEVVSVTAAARVVAARSSNSRCPLMHEQTVSAATSVGARAGRENDGGSRGNHQRQPEQGQQVERTEQQEFLRNRHEHQERPAQPFAFQQKHQPTVASLSVLPSCASTAVAARSPGVTSDQMNFRHQQTAAYSIESFRNRLVPTTADVAPAQAGVYSSSSSCSSCSSCSSGNAGCDSGTIGSSHNSITLCNSESGSRYRSNSLHNSRGCPGNSNCSARGNDTASSDNAASGNSRDSTSAVDTRSFTENRSHSRTRQISSKTPSLASKANSKGGGTQEHHTQVQRKRERHQLSHGQHYFVDHGEVYLKQQPGQSTEELKELRRQICGFQTDYKAENPLSTPRQLQNLQHTPRTEQQQQPPLYTHQHHCTTAHRLKLHATTLPLQEGFCVSKKRATAIQEQHDDARASPAPHPLTERQILNSSEGGRDRQRSSPTRCPQKGALSIELSSTSDLQRQLYTLRGQNIKPLQRRQPKEHVHGLLQDNVLAVQQASQHGQSGPFLSPSPHFSGGRQAPSLHPQGEAYSALVVSHEGKEWNDKSTLHSSRVSSKGFTARKVISKVQKEHNNNDCPCDNKGCEASPSDYRTGAEKSSEIHEQNMVHWCSADMNSRTAQPIKSQQMQARPAGDAATSAATPSANVVSEDGTSDSGRCWSHRPAYGSSRRSSLCSGTDRSSQHQSPCYTNPQSLVRGERACCTDALLEANVNASPQEEQQQVKQQLQCQQVLRRKKVHQHQQTKNPQQTQVQPLQWPQHCQRLQQTTQLPTSVEFFSPQEVTGCNQVSAGSGECSSELADCSAELASQAEDPAGSMKEYAVNSCSTQQQEPPQQEETQHHQQQQQQHHVQRNQGRETRSTAGQQEAAVDQNGGNVDQKEADRAKQDLAAPTAGEDAEATCLPLASASAPLRTDCCVPAEYSINDVSLLASGLGVPFNSKNSRAIQQLEDLLDAVQLLLSVLEGNADDLKEQLARQQEFPLAQAEQQQEQQPDKKKAPRLRELHDHQGRQEHQAHFGTRPKGGSGGIHDTLKKQRLRELHQQLNQSLMLRNQQQPAHAAEHELTCSFNSHRQAGVPELPPVDRLLNENRVQSQLQQQETRVGDRKEPQSLLQMRRQQQPGTSAVHAPLENLGLASAATVVAVTKAEKHEVTFTRVANPCTPPFRRCNSDAFQPYRSALTLAENQTMHVSARRSVDKEVADVSSLCDTSCQSFPTGDRGDQDSRISTIPTGRVSSSISSSATPAIGTGGPEEVALHEAREAVAKAAAAAERASAAAAQAAVAAQASREAAPDSAAVTAAAPNGRAVTATGLITVETGSSKSNRAEQGMPSAGRQSAVSAESEALSGTLAAAARPKAAQLASQQAVERRSSDVEWELLPQQQHVLREAVQQQNDSSSVHPVGAQQTQLGQLYRCPSQSSLCQAATTVSVPQQQGHAEQDFLSQKALLGSLPRRTETERQQHQFQQQHRLQPFEALESTERQTDVGTSMGQGLSASALQKSPQEEPGLLPQLSQWQRSVPEQQLFVPNKTPVGGCTSLHEATPQKQHATLVHWVHSSHVQQQRSPTPHQRQGPVEPGPRSPRLQQLPPREQTQVLLVQQASEDTRHRPPHAEQPPAQQKEGTLLSDFNLQQHLHEVSDETQASQEDTSLGQPRRSSAREAFSVGSLPFQKSGTLLLLSAASTPQGVGRSPAVEDSKPDPRVQKHCVPSHYQNSLLQKQRSQPQPPREPISSHLQQQRAPQPEKQEQHGEPQAPPPQQCLLSGQQDPREAAPHVETNGRSEQLATFVVSCGDERNEPQDAIQQVQQQQRGKEPQEQSQSERLELERPQQHSPQQRQRDQICDTRSGENQLHRTAFGGSTWYSPIAADVCTDTFAFVRDSAVELATVISAGETSDKSVDAGACIAAVADAAVTSAAQPLRGVEDAAADGDGATGAAPAIDSQPPRDVEGAAAATGGATDLQRRGTPVAARCCSQTVMSLSTQILVRQDGVPEKQKDDWQPGRTHDAKEGHKGDEIQADENDCFQLCHEHKARQHREAVEETCLTASFVASPATTAAAAPPAAACSAQPRSVLVVDGRDTEVLLNSGHHQEQFVFVQQEKDRQRQLTALQEKQQQRSKEQQQPSTDQRREGCEQVNTGQQQKQEVGHTEGEDAHKGRNDVQEVEQQLDRLQQLARESVMANDLQPKHQDRSEHQVQSSPGLTDEREEKESQQTLGQLHQKREPEEEMQVLHMKDVCDQLSEDQGDVAAQQQNDQMRVTQMHTETEQEEIDELARQQQIGAGKCREVEEHIKQKQYVQHDEQLDHKEQEPWIKGEDTRDIDQRSSVDLEVELSPSLSSISLPGCSPVHDLSPATREAPAAASPSAIPPGVTEAAAAASCSEVPRDASPATGMSCCEEPVTRTRAAASVAEALEAFSAQDVSLSVCLACNSEVQNDAKCVESQPLTPLEQTLHETQRNLRPVPQTENRPQLWPLNQSALHDEAAQKEKQVQPKQQFQQQGGIQPRQGVRQQQQEGSQQPRIDQREEQQDQEIREEEQVQRQRQVVVPAGVQHEQRGQPQRQQQEVRHIDQERQQHEYLDATVVGDSGGDPADTRREQFGPRVGFCSKAPTVDPELLSPVEAAAAAGTCPGTRVLMTIPHGAGAAGGGYSTAAVIASRTTPTAPSPCALPPAAKQRQHQHQQYPKELQLQQEQSLPEDATAAPRGACISQEYQRQSASGAAQCRTPSEPPTTTCGRQLRPHPLRRCSSPIDASSDTASSNVLPERITQKGVHSTCRTQKQQVDTLTIGPTDSSFSAVSSTVQTLATGPSMHATVPFPHGAPPHSIAASQHTPAIATHASVMLERRMQCVDPTAGTAARDPGRDDVTRGGGATESAGALAAGRTNAVATQAAAQETAPAAPADGTTPAATADGVAPDTVETTKGGSERVPIPNAVSGSEALLKASTISVAKAAASEAAAARGTASPTAASGVSLAYKGSETARCAVDSTLSTGAAETAGAFDGARSYPAPTAAAATTAAAGGDTTCSNSCNRRRTVSVAEDENAEKMTAAQGMTSDAHDRRRRRHSLGAVVLRLSSKYRQKSSSSSSLNNSDSSSQGKRNRCSDRRNSSIDNSVSSNIERSTANQSTCDRPALVSQQQQVTFTLEEHVSDKSSGYRQTTEQAPQTVGAAALPDISQMQTATRTTATNSGNGERNVEAAQLTSTTDNRVLSKEKEKTKHSNTKNSSRKEAVKASNCKVPPAAHAPPASMQPRLSYSFFKTHVRQQHVRHQKEQQQQEHSQHQRSLRQRLLPRRKSLSGSGTGVAEGPVQCQTPAELPGPANRQTTVAGSSGQTGPDSPAVQEEPSSSLRFFSKQFSSFSVSTGAAAGGALAAAAASLPAATPPASAGFSVASAALAGSLPVTAAVSSRTSAGFSDSAVGTRVGTSNVASGGSNASAAAGFLSTLGATSGGNTHQNMVKKQMSVKPSSTPPFALTHAAVLPSASSCPGVAMPASTARAAVASATVAEPTAGTHPLGMLRRSPASHNTGSLDFFSDGRLRFTATAAPSVAVTSFAAAAAAARSAAAAASAGAVGPERKASTQSQHLLTGGPEADSASTDWCMGRSSSSSSLSDSSRTAQRISDEQQRDSGTNTGKKSSSDVPASGKKLPRFFAFHLTHHTSRQQP